MNFKNLISTKEAALFLNLKEGTVKNKCASGELFCKKIGKQWVLDKTYLKTLKLIEVWVPFGKEKGFMIPIDEIGLFVIPQINPVVYFEIHKDRLADVYFMDTEEITIDDVDWEREQNHLYETFEDSVVNIEDFTEEYANSMGYHMLTENDEIYKAYSYYDEGANLVRIWKQDMELTYEFRITEDSVCLDEWDGHNWRTGKNGYHEYVHRIIINNDLEDAEYLVIRYSNWQGEQTKVIAWELSLEEVIDYIRNIEDGLERDLEDYKKYIMEL